MKIITNRAFDKKFLKLSTKIQVQFSKRVELFKENPANPLLKNHILHGGMSGLKAFSINGDYRVIYARINDDQIILLSIGTHNQVY